MADNASSLPDRGTTWFEGKTPPTTYSETVDIEGAVKCFDDLTPRSGAPGATTRRSGRQVTCRLVRNVSGITLNAKRLVTYQTTNIGTRIDGYVTTDDARCAGVVDDQLPTGIPDDDLGWIVVSGPCLILTPLEGDGTNVISQGDVLLALTAATSQATTAGRFQSWAGTFNVTSDVTTGRVANVALNRIGQALSAKTTANTNADCLVDLEILKDAA